MNDTTATTCPLLHLQARIDEQQATIAALIQRVGQLEERTRQSALDYLDAIAGEYLLKTELRELRTYVRRLGAHVEAQADRQVQLADGVARLAKAGGDLTQCVGTIADTVPTHAPPAPEPIRH